MPTTIKGPALFLAQFLEDKSPFNTLQNISNWASGLGYEAIQIPSWDKRCLDLEKAASSLSYADDIKGVVESFGLQISELTSHLQGQLVAVNPALSGMYDSFAPPHLQGSPLQQADWAVEQLKLAAKASKNLGLKAHGTFSGALIWHTVYPWPQRKKGQVQEAFRELATRWKPILDVFDDCDVDLCFEIHPGEDLHDGITFERFYEAMGRHPRIKILYDPSHFLLQQLNYLDFIDLYHEFIAMFHVKDAEFNPTGKSGIYGGYADWLDRPGRFRSPGDGQINFKAIFSKLAQYDFPGWAVVEWECCLKQPEDGAAEGAKFVRENIIRVSRRAFDDFAG